MGDGSPKSLDSLEWQEAGRVVSPRYGPCRAGPGEGEGEGGMMARMTGHDEGLRFGGPGLALSPVIPSSAEPKEAEEPEIGTPTLTIEEAALLSGRERDSIRQLLDAGEFPNARRAFGDGVWLIPVEDLESSGIDLQWPLEGEHIETEPPADLTAPLQREIAVLRERLRAVEALLAEREARFKDFRAAIEMLPPSLPVRRSGDGAMERILRLERTFGDLLRFIAENQVGLGARRRWPRRRYGR